MKFLKLGEHKQNLRVLVLFTEAEQNNSDVIFVEKKPNTFRNTYITIKNVIYVGNYLFYPFWKNTLYIFKTITTD